MHSTCAAPHPPLRPAFPWPSLLTTSPRRWLKVTEPQLSRIKKIVRMLHTASLLYAVPTAATAAALLTRCPAA